MLCISLYFCLCLPWLSIGKYHIFLSCLPFMALFVCEISLLISPRLSTFLSLGQWWWLVVSVLAFYPYNHSSKPAEAYSLLCKNVFERKKITKQRPGVGPLKAYFSFSLVCFSLSLPINLSLNVYLTLSFFSLFLSISCSKSLLGTLVESVQKLFVRSRNPLHLTRTATIGYTHSLFDSISLC